MNHEAAGHSCIQQHLELSGQCTLLLPKEELPTLPCYFKTILLELPAAHGSQSVFSLHHLKVEVLKTTTNDQVAFSKCNFSFTFMGQSITGMLSFAYHLW